MDNIIFDTITIRDYVLKNHLSKSEFCKRCSISTDTYDKIFKQDVNINITALFKIAREMNIRICDLFLQ